MKTDTKPTENTAESGNKSKPLLPAVLIRKQKIQKILRDCVIELDNISGEKPFDFVDVRALLSVMDNAVFYMVAEIKDIEKLNGKWTMLGKQQVTAYRFLKSMKYPNLIVLDLDALPKDFDAEQWIENLKQERPYLLDGITLKARE